ncbi:hypothetical protein JZ751_012619 [Albula glossodonta]|uniref:Uncharacterized protein n=1 Tax=Albula glossodonta TaxID=121402 RepID=A0A8T2P655_9TELE|nr:hypothetical protein JZ751_012619 [Albula glossodonta]
MNVGWTHLTACGRPAREVQLLSGVLRLNLRRLLLELPDTKRLRLSKSSGGSACTTPPARPGLYCFRKVEYTSEEHAAKCSQVWHGGGDSLLLPTTCVDQPAAAAAQGVPVLHQRHQLSLQQADVLVLRGVAVPSQLIQPVCRGNRALNTIGEDPPGSAVEPLQFLHQLGIEGLIVAAGHTLLLLGRALQVAAVVQQLVVALLDELLRGQEHALQRRQGR